MKKITAVTLALLLLAGCKAPAGETPVPTAVPTPPPTAEATPTPIAAPTPAPAAEATPTRSPGPALEPTPTPDRGDLTEEEVDRVNRAFSYPDCDWERDADRFLKVSGFFLSHYGDVRKLDFTEFLRQFPADEEPLSQGEADGLNALVGYSGYGVAARRFRRASVDAVLNKYAGITTGELADTGGPCYLPEYDSWYNFTSDFGPGSFTCVGGRVEGDTAVLWSEMDSYTGVRKELKLQKEGEEWHIRSFLRVPVDRENYLDALLVGLEAGEITEISDSWGFGRLPEAERVAELVREASQSSAWSWSNKNNDPEDRTVWDMTLTLTDGRVLDFGAGIREDMVKVWDRDALDNVVVSLHSPELYWALRTEYDSDGDGRGTIDREALEKYREAVDGYLTRQAWDPAVRVELTAFAPVQESPTLDAQVWSIGTDMTTDPPELAPRMVGNGYVDSKLRMYGIADDWYNLLVTAEGEALGFQGWYWWEAGGLTQYATVEELKEAMHGR